MRKLILLLLLLPLFTKAQQTYFPTNAPTGTTPTTLTFRYSDTDSLRHLWMVYNGASNWFYSGAEANKLFARLGSYNTFTDLNNFNAGIRIPVNNPTDSIGIMMPFESDYGKIFMSRRRTTGDVSRLNIIVGDNPLGLIEDEIMLGGDGSASGGVHPVITPWLRIKGDSTLSYSTGAYFKNLYQNGSQVLAHTDTVSKIQTQYKARFPTFGTATTVEKLVVYNTNNELVKATGMQLLPTLNEVSWDYSNEFNNTVTFNGSAKFPFAAIATQDTTSRLVLGNSGKQVYRDTVKYLPITGGNYVTKNTNQSGLSGNKDWTGFHTFTKALTTTPITIWNPSFATTTGTQVGTLVSSTINTTGVATTDYIGSKFTINKTSTNINNGRITAGYFEALTASKDNQVQGIYATAGYGGSDMTNVTPNSNYAGRFGIVSPGTGFASHQIGIKIDGPNIAGTTDLATGLYMQRMSNQGAGTINNANVIHIEGNGDIISWGNNSADRNAKLHSDAANALTFDVSAGMRVNGQLGINRAPFANAQLDVHYATNENVLFRDNSFVGGTSGVAGIHFVNDASSAFIGGALESSALSINKQSTGDITMGGATNFLAGSTTKAAFNMPVGVAKTTGVIGDFYYNSAGTLFAHDGTQYNPFVYASKANSFTAQQNITTTSQPQLTLGYDGTHRMDIGVNSAGTISFAPIGGGGFAFQGIANANHFYVVRTSTATSTATQANSGALLSQWSGFNGSSGQTIYDGWVNRASITTNLERKYTFSSTLNQDGTGGVPRFDINGLTGLASFYYGYANKGTTSGSITYNVPATVTDYTLTAANAAPTANGQVMSYTTAGVGSWASIGVARISPLDSMAGVSAGAQIIGRNLVLQSASNSVPGLVNTSTQQFFGSKEFIASSTKIDGTLNLLTTSTGTTPTGYGGLFLNLDGKTFTFAPTTGAGNTNFSFQSGATGGRTYITPDKDGTIALTNDITTRGQITLVAGVGTVTISGLTTGSVATTGFVSIGGTVTTTWQYKTTCTANTLTVTAITNTGTTNTTDTSVLNYSVK